jgi:SAM-dependent methyltransferase
LRTPDAPQPDFGSRAATYDELRPGIPGLDEALVEAADLRGRRVLDVGCGTGRFAEVLATRCGARVFGVDPTPEMLEVARRRTRPGLAFKVARAERLPFRDAWFERATMVLVCHLVDRRAAFAELRRVLAAAGVLGLVTFEPESFSRYYLGEFFPSVREIDVARFPTAEALGAELRAAGFSSVRVEPCVREATVDRETVLARIRGRHISTFDLIPEQEYARGAARAEQELPSTIRYRWELLIVVAGRASVPTAR